MKKMKLDIQLFNGSCSITSITETTDINTNQSTFTITAKTSATGSTYNAQKDAYMTAQWKYASASEWTSLTQQKFSISKDSSVSKSWSLTLTHNDDGTLENINVRIKWYITSSTNGTTGASNVTPTTIPRSSIPTLSSASINMGSSVTIYTNRYSSSFTHRIRYVFGNANGTIASNVGASTTWTPPLTLASQIPSATSGVGTIYCDTYNGSTLVGTKTINITLNVPSNVVPSVSFTQVQEAGSVPSSWGIYVKTKSRVALAISGSGIYGSSISSYRISYYGGAGTTSSATTSYLTQAGNTTFTGQVTDTRGRTASVTRTINVVDYSNPTISTAQVQRCDANGSIDNNGEYMYISYGASISSCSSKNTPSAVYKVGYRVHGTGNYTYVNLTTNANSYSASGVLFTDGIKAASSSGTKVQFSTNNSYDIQFYVKDYFMEYTNVQSLDAGFDLLNFNPSGKAMAIGKVSEAGANEELLEIGMDTRVDGQFTTNTWGTNNTIDTWVPVWRDGYLEHRVIPNTYNSTSPVLSDVIVDNIRTKNLFNKKYARRKLTYTSTNSTTALLNAFIQDIYIPVKPNTTYTLGTQTDYTSETDYRLQIMEYKADRTFIQRNQGYTKAYTITTTANTYFVRIGASIVTLNELQFEKGSSKTAYIDHQSFNNQNYWISLPEVTATITNGSGNVAIIPLVLSDGTKLKIVQGGTTTLNSYTSGQTTTLTFNINIIPGHQGRSQCLFKDFTNNNALNLQSCPVFYNTDGTITITCYHNATGTNGRFWLIGDIEFYLS